MIKTTIFSHRLYVSLARFLFCWWRHNRLLMMSQWPDNCDSITWILISNLLDIDFIHGRSCKKVKIDTMQLAHRCQVMKCFCDLKLEWIVYLCNCRDSAQDCRNSVCYQWRHCSLALSQGYEIPCWKSDSQQTAMVQCQGMNMKCN